MLTSVNRLRIYRLVGYAGTMHVEQSPKLADLQVNTPSTERKNLKCRPRVPLCLLIFKVQRATALLLLGERGREKVGVRNNGTFVFLLQFVSR